MTLSPNPRASRRRHDDGSAFMLVLIALLVLSIIGIALASLTQTELNIGSNVRTSGRVFYAADAGYAISNTRKLVKGQTPGATYILPDSVVTLGSVTVRDQVELTVLLPILTAPCNLCEINNASGYNPAYVRGNHALGVLPVRVGVKADGTTTTTIAQGTVGAMMDMQPITVPPEKAYVNADEIAKIK